MKCLMTGARGRLGTILGELLEKDGHEVIRCSRNGDAKFTCLSNFPERLREGVDAILHLAWSTVPASAEKKPGIEWREDLPLLSLMLSHLSAASARSKKPPVIVFFSTCSVYGESPTDHAKIFSENDVCRPKGWYASAKSAAEELLRQFARSGGADSLILRVSNPYGFPQSPFHLQGVIPAAITALRTNSTFRVWGDGTASKDFLDIRDLYQALITSLRAEMTGLYNVCSGESHSITEIIQLIEDTAGRKIATEYSPPAPWDVERGAYSNKLFFERTGWKPRFMLQQGIRDFMNSEKAF